MQCEKYHTLLMHLFITVTGFALDHITKLFNKLDYVTMLSEIDI